MAAASAVPPQRDYRRIIPCLDLKDGRVVKGVRFRDLQDAGDPVALARHYDREGADELFMLDITATEEGRSATLEAVRAVARQLHIPLAVGGGVRSVAVMEALLAAGAQKFIVGSAAVADPNLIAEGARAFGPPAIILSMDVRRSPQTLSGWEVVVGGGKKPTGIDAVAWARQGESLGAGELLLNSIDADGTREGYDNRLNRTVAEAVSIPVIASGGAGSPAHMKDAFIEGKVDAVLAASIFHYGHYRIADVKAYLKQWGIPVREVTGDGSERP